jgi:alkane 1-monooxygenase
MSSRPLARYALGWWLTAGLAWALWTSPWVAAAVVAGIQIALALLERVPGLRRSPAPAAASKAHPWCLRVHAVLQAGLLAVGVMVVARIAVQASDGGGSVMAEVLAAGLAVGWVTGSLGITYAHELGHRRSRADRAIAWGLMGSVLYAHFMVEHYRGHHPRAATGDDPATARRGESLWRFLPRTLAGSWRSAWSLEAAWLRQRRRPWRASPLAWAVAAQGFGLIVLASVWGWPALLFWLTQAAMAVFLLETVNYIEHYGLVRRRVDGRPEAFGVTHAWNADAALTNALLANLQRHSDHHMHPWKPYETLDAQTAGPQLPAGYAGCVMLACLPWVWRPLMERRLAALAADPVPGA